MFSDVNHKINNKNIVFSSLHQTTSPVHLEPDNYLKYGFKVDRAGCLM